MKSMTVTPPSNNRIAQLIDANLDRAREGLRVMEDWCRFGLKREDFSIQIKDWRQQLGAHHLHIYRKARLTSEDPAMGVSHPLQKDRSTPEDIFIANSSRVQEALRVLEEFTRITDPKLSEVATRIRYKTYEIKINVLNTNEGIKKRKILKDCSLYLVTSNIKGLKEIVLQTLEAGVKIVQYREKFLNDNEKIKQAKDLAFLCKKYNSNIILRGLRAVSDFEYEFQLAGMNRKLNNNIETIFLMSDVENQIISSRFVKEIAQHKGDLKKFTTKSTIKSLKNIYA